MANTIKTTKKTFIIALTCLIILTTTASADAAEEIKNAVCDVIANILFPLIVIGFSLVLLMITYAGVKYVYSADDPGGRKEAKSIIVNAIIGGILLFIAGALAALVNGPDAKYCGCNPPCQLPEKCCPPRFGNGYVCSQNCLVCSILGDIGIEDDSGGGGSGGGS